MITREVAFRQKAFHFCCAVLLDIVFCIIVCRYILCFVLLFADTGLMKNSWTIDPRLLVEESTDAAVQLPSMAHLRARVAEEKVRLQAICRPVESGCPQGQGLVIVDVFR